MNDPRLSPPETKAGRLQRAALRRLLAHQAAGEIPTSGRFLFYELEHEGVVSKVTTGVRRSDQDLIDALLQLRLRGIVPWDWIVDETRSLTRWNSAPTVRDALMLAAERARLSPWTAEEPAPLIITESRSLAGVLDRLCQRYLVDITSSNGQAHGHLMTEVLPVYRESRRVLTLGDLDLAGGHIGDHTRRVLEEAGGPAVLWERLAITPEQVEAHGLTPIAKNDQRYKGGRGQHEAWETEALGQSLVVDLVRTRLEALLPEPLQDVLERQDREREDAIRRLRRWR